jgi:hypothetical protein
MIRLCCALTAAALFTLAACGAWAQEFKVARIESAAPADAVSPEIAALLAPTGFKLIKGDSRTVCEVWPCKEWPVAADAKPGLEVITPLTPGQLIGVIRYPRKATDFREQDINSGVYTLRYGQQPVDGAHVGTSPTRDFLVVSPADSDKSPAVLDYKALVESGKATSGTSHPAILSLQPPGDAQEPLAVRENTEKEWTIVRFSGKVSTGGQAKDLALAVVLVGVAKE